MKAGRHEMAGTISSVGFTSGDRVVVGRWERSPLGPIVDVMWARPGGERVLLAPSDDVAAFVGAVYVFDRVEVVALSVAVADRPPRLAVAAGPLRVLLEGGPRAWRLPPERLRPAWTTRVVEAPVARALMGVRPYGVSPTGVREWYRADSYRPLTRAAGTLDGVDLGAMAPIDPPGGFGFSEPPRRPAMVAVRPLLHDPSGRLDEVLNRLTQVKRGATGNT